LPFEVAGKTIYLVDDVLYTGRTIRAALDELSALGRPARIILAVLIDRGGRELPIAADHVAASIPAEPGNEIQVHLTEEDREDAVLLYRRS
jgi:pyrimidine operon attenuation protein/uracil phosphoribosyltransferase